tara:strand:- start:157 stop:741 length:585 start_codon:yes stop_codon:yes gene_type:complete
MKIENHEVIKQLIEIGKLEAIPSNKLHINLINSRGHKSPSFDIYDCKSLPIDDLKSLYKGLVLSEKEFEWQDGSATKTSRILQLLNDRLDFEEDYKDIKALYEFGFANRGHNDYVPTGTGIHHTCITFEDYLELNLQKAKKNAKHEALMLQQQAESKRMKAVKKEFNESVREERLKERAARKKERDKNISIIKI